MRWTDVVAPPKPRVLRQFAGLWLLLCLGAAIWRAWHGEFGWRTDALAAAALVVGLPGLWRPTAVRVVYTGLMVVGFPIGWVVSHLMLAAAFYGVFTPIAIVFRLMGRDVLWLRKPRAGSYWTSEETPKNPADYFRQF